MKIQLTRFLHTMGEDYEFCFVNAPQEQPLDPSSPQARILNVYFEGAVIPLATAVAAALKAPPSGCELFLVHPAPLGAGPTLSRTAVTLSRQPAEIRRCADGRETARGELQATVGGVAALDCTVRAQ